MEIPKSKELDPKASLEYWTEANKKVISFCKQYLEGKYLLINYDNLCLNPGKEIERLIFILGVKNIKIDIEKLCSLIKKPVSIGRYKKYDLSIFEKKQIDVVKELGFEINY